MPFYLILEEPDPACLMVTGGYITGVFLEESQAIEAYNALSVLPWWSGMLFRCDVRTGSQLLRGEDKATEPMLLSGWRRFTQYNSIHTRIGLTERGRQLFRILKGEA